MHLEDKAKGQGCFADLVSQPVQQLGLDLALVALHSPSLLFGAGLWLLVRGLRLARGPRGAWGCCSCGCCRVVDACCAAAAGCGWLARTGLSEARRGTACMQLWGCTGGSAGHCMCEPWATQQGSCRCSSGMRQTQGQGQAQRKQTAADSGGTGAQAKQSRCAVCAKSCEYPTCRCSCPGLRRACLRGGSGAAREDCLLWGCPATPRCIVPSAG